jgi:hypothetical protein
MAPAVFAGDGRRHRRRRRLGLVPSPDDLYNLHTRTWSSTTWRPAARGPLPEGCDRVNHHRYAIREYYRFFGFVNPMTGSSIPGQGLFSVRARRLLAMSTAATIGFLDMEQSRSTSNCRSAAGRNTSIPCSTPCGRPSPRAQSVLFHETLTAIPAILRLCVNTAFRYTSSAFAASATTRSSRAPST